MSEDRNTEKEETEREESKERGRSFSAIGEEEEEERERPLSQKGRDDHHRNSHTSHSLPLPSLPHTLTHTHTLINQQKSQNVLWFCTTISCVYKKNTTHPFSQLQEAGRNPPPPQPLTACPVVCEGVCVGWCV